MNEKDKHRIKNDLATGCCKVYIALLTNLKPRYLARLTNLIDLGEFRKKIVKIEIHPWLYAPYEKRYFVLTFVCQNGFCFEMSPFVSETKFETKSVSKTVTMNKYFVVSGH